MVEFFAYRTVVAVHFIQSRTESLKSFIVSGVRWSVKLVLPTGTQKLHFCVRPWLLLTILNFSEWGPTDTTVF